MATITGNFVSDNSSLANFKSWAQSISTAFSTFGWVQTADTGQVNWSTISVVPSSTYVYEIWKANDSLAATMPIFVQINYGFSATSPRIQITVGTGSSGSGVINGQVFSGAPWNLTTNNTNQGSLTYPCFFSGTSGEFRMWMWGVIGASPNIGTLLVIERSKDGSGNNTSNYITVCCANQNNAGFGALPWQQVITTTGVGNRDNVIMALALTTTSGTGSAFGTVAAFPVFPLLGQVGNPMIGLMTICAGDAAPNSIVTVTSMYGSTHTYVVCAGGTMSQALGQRTLNTFTPMSALMRYE